MSANPFQPAIDKLLEEVREQQTKLSETKALINSLRERAGETPLFADEALPSPSTATTLRRDEFYGQPLAKCVRQILEARHAARLGAATITEIFAQLVAGGYDDADPTSEVNSKRNISISLSKNSQTFHRLPGKEPTYGLLEWYPTAKRRDVVEVPAAARVPQHSFSVTTVTRAFPPPALKGVIQNVNRVVDNANRVLGHAPTTNPSRAEGEEDGTAARDP